MYALLLGWLGLSFQLIIYEIKYAIRGQQFHGLILTCFLCAAQAAGAAMQADHASNLPSCPAAPWVHSPRFQLELWAWDVFICHAGEDKPFGLCLYRRLVRAGLRSFLDEVSLRVGGDAPAAMKAAVHSSQIAVVLLSEEFFQKPWPQKELRWFLERRKASRSTVVPVFLGITVERCALQRPYRKNFDGMLTRVK